MLAEGVQSTQTDLDRKECGCYFYCVLKLVECVTHKDFTQEDVETIARDAIAAGYMDKVYYLEEPHRIANLAAGTNLFRTVFMRVSAPDTPYYVILNKKPHYDHYTLHTPDGTWDPLDPKRPGAKGYTVDSYREFVLS